MKDSFQTDAKIMKVMKSYICLALALGLLSACTRFDMSENQASAGMDDTVGAVFLEEKLIVKFDEDMIALIEADLASGVVVTKSSELNRLTESLDIKSMKRLFPHAGEYEARTRAEGLHKWYCIECGPSITMTRASESFRSLPGVEFVEQVPKVKTTSQGFFNDPLLSGQWHYYYDDGLPSIYSARVNINVEPVWRNYTTGNENVIVSVVDGGIDMNHEDLKDNLIGGFNYCKQGPMVNSHYHGTHVAGTIAAINNNGIGVSGIAGGDKAKGIKGVKLFSSQIFDYGTSADDYIYTALKEGADYGAVISQNSWGYEDYDAIPTYATEAIDYFIKYAGCDNDGNQRPDSPMKGGVVIFAAGNESSDWASPSGYAPVIAVGAVDHTGFRADYSNYGYWVDICAPGGDDDLSHVLSTYLDNEYRELGGTSMACPHVSGVAALIVSYFGGPGFTNEMLEEKLIKGARSDLGTEYIQIGPFVDALGAFEYGSKAPESVASADVSAIGNTVTLRFKVTADSDNESGKAYGYMALASTERAGLDEIDIKNLPPDAVSAVSLVGERTVGQEMEVSLEGLEYGTKYYVAVVAYDCYRNYSGWSPVYEAVTDSNRPPVITTDHTGVLTVGDGEVVRVTYNISDPDGDGFTVDFESGSEAVTCKYNPDGGCMVTVSGKDAHAGQYEAKLTATDMYGATSEALLEYSIQ